MPDNDDLVRLQKRVRRLESHVGRLNFLVILGLVAAAMRAIYGFNPEWVGLLILVAFCIGVVVLPFLLLIWFHGMAVPEAPQKE